MMRMWCHVKMQSPRTSHARACGVGAFPPVQHPRARTLVGSAVDSRPLVAAPWVESNRRWPTRWRAATKRAYFPLGTSANRRSKAFQGLSIRASALTERRRHTSQDMVWRRLLLHHAHRALLALPCRTRLAHVAPCRVLHHQMPSRFKWTREQCQRRHATVVSTLTTVPCIDACAFVRRRLLDPTTLCRKLHLRQARRAIPRPAVPPWAPRTGSRAAASSS